MNFEQKIQQWVSIDDKIKQLSETINELREKKNALNENILNHVENNKLQDTTIQLNNGKIKFISTKISSQLTFKYVEKTLGEIIKNQDQVKQIVDCLKNKREFKSISEIKRIYNK